MSGTIQNNLITVRQGDSFTINIEVKNGCKPLNLTGASLLMQVKDSGGNAVISVSGTDVDVAKGKMALILTSNMTNVALGDYGTDIQLTMSDGSVNTIWPQNVNQIGIFRITQQITEE